MRLHQKLTAVYEGRPRFFSILYHRTSLDHQAGLSDPVRELDLPVTKAQLLGSQHLLEDVWMCHFIGTGRRVLRSTSRWMVMWYSAMTSVGWWKICSFSITLNSGGSSSIHPRLVWRQFYCIMTTSAIQYLWLTQFTRKKAAPPFKVGWRNVLPNDWVGLDT